MEKYSGATPSIKAYRVTGYWESSTTTWNNQPSYTTTYASPTAYNDSGNWWRMTVTDIIKRWFNGTYSKYGFMVRDNEDRNGNGIVELILIMEIHLKTFMIFIGGIKRIQDSGLKKWEQRLQIW